MIFSQCTHLLPFTLAHAVWPHKILTYNIKDEHIFDNLEIILVFPFTESSS